MFALRQKVGAEEFKYLHICIKNRLKWKSNTVAADNKRMIWLHFSRTFDVCNKIIKILDTFAAMVEGDTGITSVPTPIWSHGDVFWRFPLVKRDFSFLLSRSACSQGSHDCFLFIIVVSLPYNIHRCCCDLLLYEYNWITTFCTTFSNRLIQHSCRNSKYFISHRICNLPFMNAPPQYVNRLNAVYHCALHFVTGCGNRVRHRSLYAAAKWPSLYICRLSVFLPHPNSSV